MKRLCPAARKIQAELLADLAREAYARNPSHRNRLRMLDARTAALKVGRR